MGDLYQYFLNNHSGRLVQKWLHYFDIYERHFEPFRNQPIRLLEFGVDHGGSLQMWRHYFGPQAQIIGVDIDPACAALAEPGIDIVIGDQEDPELHRQLREKYGDFDLIIDDGGHTMRQLTVTFLEMYPALKPGGIYLAEDLHSSYLSQYDGGCRKPGTFIELSKTFIDQLYAWYATDGSIKHDYITLTTYGIFYYDSILVVEKRPITAPTALMTGIPRYRLQESSSLLAARNHVALANFEQALDICSRTLMEYPDSTESRKLIQEILDRQE